jgi:hypothetical protein
MLVSMHDALISFTPWKEIKRPASPKVSLASAPSFCRDR